MIMEDTKVEGLVRLVLEAVEVQLERSISELAIVGRCVFFFFIFIFIFSYILQPSAFPLLLEVRSSAQAN